MELVIEVAGWIAAGVLLAAYALLSRGRLNGRGAHYQLLNVVGSLLVGLNSLLHRAWPSVSVNIVWLVIGSVTLGAMWRSRHRAAAAARTPPVAELPSTTTHEPHVTPAA